MKALRFGLLAIVGGIVALAALALFTGNAFAAGITTPSTPPLPTGSAPVSAPSVQAPSAPAVSAPVSAPAVPAAPAVPVEKSAPSAPAAPVQVPVQAPVQAPAAPQVSAPTAPQVAVQPPAVPVQAPAVTAPSAPSVPVQAPVVAPVTSAANSLTQTPKSGRDSAAQAPVSSPAASSPSALAPGAGSTLSIARPGKGSAAATGTAALTEARNAVTVNRTVNRRGSADRSRATRTSGRSATGVRSRLGPAAARQPRTGSQTVSKTPHQVVRSTQLSSSVTRVATRVSPSIDIPMTQPAWPAGALADSMSAATTQPQASRPGTAPGRVPAPSLPSPPSFPVAAGGSVLGTAGGGFGMSGLLLLAVAGVLALSWSYLRQAAPLVPRGALICIPIPPG